MIFKIKKEKKHTHTHTQQFKLKLSKTQNPIKIPKIPQRSGSKVRKHDFKNGQFFLNQTHHHF